MSAADARPDATAPTGRDDAAWRIDLLVVLFALSGFAYLSWRVSVVNPAWPLFSLVVLAAESFAFLGILVAAYIMRRPRRRELPVAAAGLRVDVLIPTLNEPLAVVRLTVVAALAIRYPHRTVLLDDGRRPEILRLARELGCDYLARADNVAAKAGNLNFGLAHCNGEFVAVFDVDHVPDDSFLDRLLGYFKDPGLAYVQTPQDFYNVESIAFAGSGSGVSLWHDQKLFYGMGQRGRDRLEATTLCGTGFIIRRAALDAVGGFATETATEDMHTAVRLIKRGWRGAYHPESLAFGIAASDYVEFLKQRLRWGHGNVQTLREEGLPFCAGLSFAQRVGFTALGVSYFEGWARLVLYLTPPLVLLTPASPMLASEYYLACFLPYALVGYLLMRALGRGEMRWLENERMAMARFPVALLATMGLFQRRGRWRITAKVARERVPLLLFLPQLAIGVANLAGVAASVMVSGSGRIIATDSMDVLAPVAIWAGFNAWIALSTLWQMRNSPVDAAARGFPIPLDAELALPGQAIRAARTRRLSVDEIVLDLEGDEFRGPRAGGQIALRLRDRVFRLRADLDLPTGRSVRTLRCRLYWEDLAERDEFARLLHACRWWRPLVWSDDAVARLA